MTTRMPPAVPAGLALLLLACAPKNPVTPTPAPVVQLAEVTDILVDRASFRVVVTREGATDLGYSIGGVCVAPPSTAEIDTGQCESTTVVAGTLLFTVPGLTPATTYRVRAWVEGGGRRIYSNILTFQTAALTPPSVATGAVSGVTATGASVAGSVSFAGNTAVTERGVCYGVTPTPLRTGTCALAGSGAGSFSVILTGLNPGVTYFARAFATNASGTAYGSAVTFTTSAAATSCPAVTDIDGTVYPSVRIGNACWTQANLRVTRYRNGDDIPLDNSGGSTGNDGGTTWSGRTAGARTVYANASNNLGTYGFLYSARAVLDTRGLCPSGWHVPSAAEWDAALSALGGRSVAGGALKATSTWDSPNTGATNTSGFTALPGGTRGTQTFAGIGRDGYFWSSTMRPDNQDIVFELLAHNEASVLRGASPASLGMSVRCVQD